MLTLDELTPEAKEALIACYRIAAARGRQLRLGRQKAAMQKEPNGSGEIKDVDCNKCDEEMVMKIRGPALMQTKSPSQMAKAQDGHTVYNVEPRSTAPHESMDNNDRSDHNQRISPRLFV